MPIDVQCDKCAKRIRVGDNFAGKRIKCPSCQNILTVGAAATPSVSPKAATTETKAPAGETVSIKIDTSGSSANIATGKIKTAGGGAAGKKGESKYHVRVEAGDIFGPITKTELNQWAKEGRLTADCHILLDGSEQWQWATDLFPQLEASQPSSNSTESPAPATSDSAVADSAAGFNFADGTTPAVTPTISKGKSKSKKRSVGNTPEGEESDRKKLVAALLAFFPFGMCGAHRFYLGYVWQGVVQGLTVGGFFIWALVDFVLILMDKLPDVHGRRLKQK